MVFWSLLYLMVQKINLTFWLWMLQLLQRLIDHIYLITYPGWLMACIFQGNDEDVDI